MAVIVASFEFPLVLNPITPVFAVMSLTEILKFPAGATMYPDRDTATQELTADVTYKLAITVVPSHSFTS